MRYGVDSLRPREAVKPTNGTALKSLKGKLKEIAGKLGMNAELEDE